MTRSKMFRIGRIYLKANEQGVQEWKEEVADLTESQSTGGSVVEGTGCRFI
jgi:hypothetical protein